MWIHNGVDQIRSQTKCVILKVLVDSRDNERLNYKLTEQLFPLAVSPFFYFSFFLSIFLSHAPTLA